MCENECTSDADCSGDLKCCVHGCGSSCVVAMGGGQGHGDSSMGTVTVEAVRRLMNVSEGGLAELECTARGSPRPDLMWVKVDSNEKVGC